MSFSGAIDLILNLAIPRFSNVLFRTTQVFFLEAEGSSRADIKNRLKRLKNFVGIDVALPFHSVCQGTTRMEYLSRPRILTVTAVKRETKT